jgi:hypothetical protein
LAGDQIQALRKEVRAHITAIRRAYEGNLAYWDVDR